MNRIKCILALAVLVTIGVVSNSFAAELAGKWEVSAMGGAAFPTEEDQDAGAYAGGRVIYNVSESMGVGAEAGWENFEQEEDGQDYGDVVGVPVLANLILRLPNIPNESKVTPYVLGGIGVIFWEFDESSLLTSNGVSVDGDTSFAAKVAGGIDVDLKENIAIFAEGGYLWSDYEAEVNAGGSVVADTIDTDAAYVVGGLKIRF